MEAQSTRTTSRLDRFTSRTVLAVCALGTVLCIVSCGGGADSSPSSPTTVAPAPRLLQQGNFTLAAPEEDEVYFSIATITDASSGLWEATVDWAIPTNTLWMWVANGACSVEQFSRPDCPFEATCPCQFTVRSETATPKPRVLTIPNAAGGTRTLFIVNLGPREEAGTYRVMLTPTNIVASSAAATPAATRQLATGKKVIRRR